MEIFESKIRQVGTSLGLLIPKDVAVADKLKKNQVVKVAILRKNDALIEKAFGLVKSKPFVRDHNDRVIWLLLDTCAWVEVFNGTDKGMAVKQILHEHQCFTSAISIAELSEWIERENSCRKEVLEIVTKTSFILGIEQDLLELAGILKFKKRRTMPDFGMIDAIILATAQQYNLTVVTGDKHFEGENTVFL